MELKFLSSLFVPHCVLTRPTLHHHHTPMKNSMVVLVALAVIIISHVLTRHEMARWRDGAMASIASFP